MISGYYKSTFLGVCRISRVNQKHRKIQGKGLFQLCSLAQSQVLLCTLISLFCSLTGAQGQEVEFTPYEAQVSVGQAAVHAIPSQNGYVTELLARGALVEVYRHDPGGWCAIRPTPESFSLVAASAVDYRPGDSTGIVKVDGAKAWVGTRISHTGQPLWQVKLREGEMVEVLATKEIPTGADGGAEKWLVISPPAGEFRWINIKSLSREATPARADVTFVRPPNPEEIEKREAEKKAERTRFAENSERQSAFAEGDRNLVAKSDSPTPELATNENRVAALPSESLLKEQSSPVQPNAAQPNAVQDKDAPIGTGTWETRSSRGNKNRNNASSSGMNSNRNGTLSTSRGDAGANTKENKANVTAEQFSEIYYQAELAIADVLLKDPDAAGLMRLRQLSNQLKETAQTVEQRVATDRVDQKIAKLEDNYVKMATLRANSKDTRVASSVLVPKRDSTPRNPAEVLRDTLGYTAPADHSQVKYTSQGTLNRLQNVNTGAKEDYVIQNKNGGIVAVVVGTPGFNLERYLNKEVAIVGQETKNKKNNLPVIVAERLVEVDKVR